MGRGGSHLGCRRHQRASHGKEGDGGLKGEILFPGTCYTTAFYLKCRRSQHKDPVLPITNPLRKAVLIFFHKRRA